MSQLEEIKARAEVNAVLGKTASQDEAKATLKLVAALEAVLSHAAAEEVEYKEEGPSMGEWDQLFAAGRAEYAEELQQRITGALQ